DRVVEVDEVRYAVDAVPGDGLTAEEGLAYRFELGALVPDLRVAVHAERRGGKPGAGRGLDRLMAVAAVDALVDHVVPVIELHGLGDGLVLAGAKRRTHPDPAESERHCRHQCQDRQRQPGQVVRPPRKERGQPGSTKALRLSPFRTREVRRAR